MSIELDYLTLSRMDVAIGATTPVPSGGPGSIIWSNTVGDVLKWNGSAWVSNVGLGTLASQDASSVQITDVQVDGALNVTGNAALTTVNATGFVKLGGEINAEAFHAVPAASTVNWIEAHGGVTGQHTKLRANGADATIPLALVAKDSSIQFFTNAAASVRGFNVSHNANAVNYLQAQGNVVGQPPTLTAQGTDANIDMYYGTKGTGNHVFATGSLPQFQVQHVTSAVNYLTVRGAATGSRPVIEATGTDANVGIYLNSKGTGTNVISNGGGWALTTAYVAGSVNYTQFTGGATGVRPRISVQGADTDTGLTFSAKGLGTFRFDGSGGNSVHMLVGGSAAGVNYILVQGSDAGQGPTITASGTDANINLTLAPKGTGQVVGVSKAMVGLGSVDNVPDADKPVSTFQQSALDLKFDKAGGAMGGNINMSNYLIHQSMFQDVGLVFVDKGTATADHNLDYTDGCHQRLQVGAAFTLTTNNWPPSGYRGQIMLELVNGAAFAVTWPTINWVKNDGSFTTTFASNGVTLQISGTDFVLLWTRDGGTTIYGKVMR